MRNYNERKNAPLSMPYATADLFVTVKYPALFASQLVHERERQAVAESTTGALDVDVNFLSSQLARARVSASLIRSERQYYFHAR